MSHQHHTDPNPSIPTTEQLIQSLDLQEHPLEGGFFRRTYQSSREFNTPTGRRKLLTSIFYLLTTENPIGYFHSNRSDIVHYYHLGAPLEYTLISPEGEVSRFILGSDILRGQQLQLTVKGGWWKASRLLSGHYGLISEAVAPGFEYEDNTLGATHLLNLVEESEKAAIKALVK